MHVKVPPAAFTPQEVCTALGKRGSSVLSDNTCAYVAPTGTHNLQTECFNRCARATDFVDANRDSCFHAHTVTDKTGQRTQGSYNLDDVCLPKLDSSLSSCASTNTGACGKKSLCGAIKTANSDIMKACASWQNTILQDVLKLPNPPGNKCAKTILDVQTALGCPSSGASELAKRL